MWTKMTTLLSQPLTVSSLGTLSLIIWTTLSGAFCLSDGLFLLDTSLHILFWWCHFLLMRFALDISCSSQPFLLTALKLQTWHTLLSRQPLPLEPLSLEVSFFRHPCLLESLFLNPFLLTVRFLATNKNMESATLDQPHIDAKTHLFKKTYTKHQRSLGRSHSTVMCHHCLANHFSLVLFALSTLFSSYIFRTRDFRVLNFPLYPFINWKPPSSHAHWISLHPEPVSQAWSIRNQFWTAASLRPSD